MAILDAMRFNAVEALDQLRVFITEYPKTQDVPDGVLSAIEALARVTDNGQERLSSDAPSVLCALSQARSAYLDTTHTAQLTNIAYMQATGGTGQYNDGGAVVHTRRLLREVTRTELVLRKLVAKLYGLETQRMQRQLKELEVMTDPKNDKEWWAAPRRK